VEGNSGSWPGSEFGTGHPLGQQVAPEIAIREISDPFRTSFLMLKFLPAAALFIAACASSSPQTPAEKSPVEGSWQWVETSGGKMGTTRGPDSEQYELITRFGSDGQFEITKGGVPWVSGSYVLTDSERGAVVQYALDASPSSTTVFTFSGLGDPPRHIFSINADSMLVLDEGCCDRYQHVFRRAK
jgi:hypothetical protein